MKKIGVVLVTALLCASLGACAGTETEALPQTIRTADKRISVSVPEGWSEYAAELKDNMALALQSGGGAFAQIFWYPDVEGKDLTALDYVTEAAGYYGETVTGSAAKITVVNTDDGYYFAYKIEVKDEEAAGTSQEAAATDEISAGTSEEAAATDEVSAGTSEEAAATDEVSAGTSEEAAATDGETAATGEETAAADAEPDVLETYQGYEYFIRFPGGVVEVDIFFHFTDTAPTNDELAVLRSIAETIRVK